MLIALLQGWVWFFWWARVLLGNKLGIKLNNSFGLPWRLELERPGLLRALLGREGHVCGSGGFHIVSTKIKFIAIK